MQQLACLNIDDVVSSELKEVQWTPFRALNRLTWFRALVSATSITLCSVSKIPPKSSTHSLARLVFEVPLLPWCPPGHDPVAKRKVISHKPCDAQWCWFIAREPANSRRAFSEWCLLHWEGNYNPKPTVYPTDMQNPCVILKGFRFWKMLLPGRYCVENLAFPFHLLVLCSHCLSYRILSLLFLTNWLDTVTFSVEHQIWFAPSFCVVVWLLDTPGPHKRLIKALKEIE